MLLTLIALGMVANIALLLTLLKTDHARTAAQEMADVCLEARSRASHEGRPWVLDRDDARGRWVVYPVEPSEVMSAPKESRWTLKKTAEMLSLRVRTGVQWRPASASATWKPARFFANGRVEPIALVACSGSGDVWQMRLEGEGQPVVQRTKLHTSV